MEVFFAMAIQKNYLIRAMLKQNRAGNSDKNYALCGE
jgi:hypothetical protein